MNTLNAALAALTKLTLAPFMGMPSQVALIILSALSGVLAAVAFRYTSSQQGLKRVADEIRASLLGMRLFKEDIWVTFRIQARLFKASGKRLAYSLPPMLVLIVPFVFALAQLAMWYEFQPLAPNQTAHVEVKINPEAWSKFRDLRLETPAAVVAEQRVRSEREHAIYWRIRPTEAAAGDAPTLLKWRLGDGKTIEKQLAVVINPGGSELGFVSPERPGPSFWDRLLFPGEPAFGSDSPIRSIKIDYPARANTLFGLEIHWLITFFVVSILGALAAKPFIKVQF